MKISMLNKILIDKYSEYLESIDVEINGNRPWDLTEHNPDVFKSILFNGSLGFGESYMTVSYTHLTLPTILLV